MFESGGLMSGMGGEAAKYGQAVRGLGTAAVGGVTYGMGTYAGAPWWGNGLLAVVGMGLGYALAFRDRHLSHEEKRWRHDERMALIQSLPTAQRRAMLRAGLDEDEEHAA